MRGPAMRGPGFRGLPGKWWQDPNVRQRLALTDDQTKRMEEVFRAHRLRLIDLNAQLQREEAALEPLLEADAIDETKAVAQSDRVVQARADLEKANSRFLIGMRRILTPDQWRKMEAERHQMPQPPQPPRSPQEE
jgi:Spy/CpxP family protein refolding chaperone